MRIIDTYSTLLASLRVADAHPVFRAWGYTDDEIARWFRETSTPEMLRTAEAYRAGVSTLVQRIERFFGAELPGELVLIPSFDEVDGFARYDRGHHTVMLGIDFPGASLDYLRALTAHELSHVYRDHSPRVWGFLGKPIAEVTRDEYLEATSGREHLVSEGLATLTSQAIFPDVSPVDHHYYDADEWAWCLEHAAEIEQALARCLQMNDPDPWKFYRPGSAGPGSPSRTHYYWAARRIGEWIRQTPGMTLLAAHALPAAEITAF